ncbi:MAG: ABC transporter ATP-binding protein [Myxococcota bacterium]
MSDRSALAVRGLRVVRTSRTGAFELCVDELELRRGEALAVLGPNGAGKSTLLRALAGLEPPAAGRVERGAEGPVTLVFQRPIALAGSVEHNLRVAIRAARLRGAAARRRVYESLEHFGILTLASRRASTLSGGELRRLALARAFVLEPSVLLLDEPFDDLDAQAQEALSLDLRRLVRERDIALALVSHDLRRALLLSDRIAALLEGRLVQQGPRQEVLDRPATDAVARLVGMSNLIPGRVSAERSGNLVWVEIDSEHRLLAPPRFAPGTRVWVGIRPEHLKVELGERGSGHGDPGVPLGKGITRHIVSDGAVATAHVAWGDLVLRTHLLAGRGLARSLASGQVLSLSVPPRHIHLIRRDG